MLMDKVSDGKARPPILLINKAYKAVTPSLEKSK